MTLAVALVVGAFGAAPVAAQPRTPEQEAAALLELARQQLDLNCTDCSPNRALDFAARARQLHPTALSLQFIAIAEKRLERYLEAEQHMLEALTLSSGPVLDDAQRQAALRTLADIRLHLSDLRVECRMPGVDVYLNDRFRGRTDESGVLTVRTARGTYDVRLRIANRPPIVRPQVAAMEAEVVVSIDPEAEYRAMGVDPELLRQELEAEMQARLAAERDAHVREMERELAAERERSRLAIASARVEDLEEQREEVIAGNAQRVARRRRAWSMVGLGVGTLGIGTAMVVQGLADSAGPDTTDCALTCSCGDSDRRTTIGYLTASSGLGLWVVGTVIGVRSRPSAVPDAPSRTSETAMSMQCSVLPSGGIVCGGRF